MEKNSMFISDWTNVVAEGRNELVFENKNKNYGAYQIRRNYNRSLLIALGISVSVFIFFISLPKIIEFFSAGEEVEVIKGPTDVVIDLTPPPPLDPAEPPPPPPPPPPLQTTVQFVPPVVVDEPVEDETPPIQEELVETKVASVTQEGTDDGEVIIPVETGPAVIETKQEEVFTIVEQMPEFAGGYAAMNKFLTENIVYPPIGRDERIQGKVFLKFKVDKEGQISDIEVQRGIKGYPAFEKEAIRVVKKMPPWKAGKQNGKAVSVWFTIPISFSLGG